MRPGFYDYADKRCEYDVAKPGNHDFRFAVHMSLLREGTRFVATNHNGVVVTGVTIMDGHKVSDHYGFRKGNLYYDDESKNYINVKLDGIEYSDSPWEGPQSSTLYEKDKWVFKVTKAVRDQAVLDMEYNKNLTANLEKLRKKEELLQKHREAIAEVARLEREIGNLN